MSKEQQSTYPKPRVANYVLALLVFAYILSFVDRNILAVMVGPIREEFSLTDFEFSILHGWAFTLFYIFLGFPIAWLADRFSRKWIIVSGIALWSCMTGVCGLAKTHAGLFLARAGVGVGEAALSPAAYSLFGDYFPPKRLKYATSIYASGIALGSGGSYMIGGWLYEWYASIGAISVPALGIVLKPWQMTFVSVGLPGFIIAFLLLMVREPPRKQTALDTGDPVPVNAVWLHLCTYRLAYFGVIGSMSMMAIVGYGVTIWLPEFFFRTHGMSKSASGTFLGLVFIVGGCLGTICGAPMAGWLERRGYGDANLRLVALIASAVALPSIAAALVPSAWLSMVLFAIAQFFQFAHAGVGLAALQLITPNRMRAQVSALFLFATSLFGLALGGSCIAFFTDYVFKDDYSLHYSMAVVALVFYPLAASVAWVGLSGYRQAQRAIS